MEPHPSSLPPVDTARVSVESRVCSIGRIQQQEYVDMWNKARSAALMEPHPSSLPPVDTARVSVESRVCSISRIQQQGSVGMKLAQQL